MLQITREPAIHLEVEQLSVTIKRKKILDHLSLSLVSPNIYGIVGPNGTGKSVLLKTLLGFIRPSAGSVKMNGVRVDPRHDLPVSVGAIIEHPGFIGDLNGHDNLMALGNIRSQLSDADIRAIMEKVGLSDDRKAVADYSLGMIQRLGIAQAIMEDQQLILLDEPTNALDREGVAFLTDLLRELRDQGKLVVVASHDFMWLQLLADQIFELTGGQLNKLEAGQPL